MFHLEVTVTCGRCGKRHVFKYDYLFRDRPPSDEDINLMKRQKPLCSRCQKLASSR